MPSAAETAVETARPAAEADAAEEQREAERRQLHADSQRVIREAGFAGFERLANPAQPLASVAALMSSLGRPQARRKPKKTLAEALAEKRRGSRVVRPEAELAAQQPARKRKAEAVREPHLRGCELWD